MSAFHTDIRELATPYDGTAIPQVTVLKTQRGTVSATQLSYIQKMSHTAFLNSQRSMAKRGQKPIFWRLNCVIQAVIFDAFGTTLHISCRTKPYQQLLREGAKHGRRPRPDDLHHLMTHNLGLRDAADNLGIQVAPIRMLEIEGALQRELDSIEVYQDALEAFAILQNHGIAIAVCSNLAAPYGPAVKALLPNHAAYALSYELGMMKPEPGIYRSACNELGIVPERLFKDATEVVMIGDSPRCDRDGPRTIGIQGFHLDRKDSGPIHDLKQFAEFVVNSPRDSHR